MDLHEEWKKWQESAQIEKEELILPKMDQLRQSTKSPIKKIKKLFYLQFTTLTLFICIFTFIIFNEQEWLIRGFIFVLWVAFIYGLRLAIVKYQMLLTHTRAEQNLFASITGMTTSFRKWQSFSEKLALFLLPIATLGGFFYGFTRSAPLEKFFEEKELVLFLLIYVSVTTPAIYLFSKWINKKTFGKWLDQLDNHVALLNEDKP